MRKTVHNCATGTVEVRDMTPAEEATLAAMPPVETVRIVQPDEAVRHRQAARAKLKALGLDDDEIDALGLR